MITNYIPSLGEFLPCVETEKDLPLIGEIIRVTGSHPIEVITYLPPEKTAFGEIVFPYRCKVRKDLPYIN